MDFMESSQAKSDWPPLYDVEVLRRNEVPVAAAAYYEDMYVEMALSQQTANEIKVSNSMPSQQKRHHPVSSVCLGQQVRAYEYGTHEARRRLNAAVCDVCKCRAFVSG